MILARQARETLAAVEMLHGDTLKFRLRNGSEVPIELLDTGAAIIETNLPLPLAEDRKGRTTYRFWADLRVDGREIRYEREVGTDKSFYEPLTVSGVNIWLDAVDEIFAFMLETHGPCRLNPTCTSKPPHYHHARLAVQDAALRICPEPVHPWCPLPEGGLRIEMCYTGEDCWMGAYFGASAHGGLDINHPKGTLLYTPIDLDDQFLVNSVAHGWTNNRWHGIRHWPDHSTWVLRSAHMVKQLVPEHTPVRAGTVYAEGAGVWVGQAEHSHFAFSALDHGSFIRLDPWILFWQMYQDLAA
jgi:hypothetical protein